MHKSVPRIMGLVAVAAWSAFGAFVPPTDAQLRQAVAAPPTLVALLKGASALQAAETTGKVIERIVAADLPKAKRDAQLSAVVAQAFKAMADATEELAQALGAAMAVTRVESAVLSIIQQAVIRAAGAVAGAAFGAAYTQQVVALTPAVTHPNLRPSAVAMPPRPPVATPYEGQGLR